MDRLLMPRISVVCQRATTSSPGLAQQVTSGRASVPMVPLTAASRANISSEHGKSEPIHKSALSAQRADRLPSEILSLSETSSKPPTTAVAPSCSLTTHPSCASMSVPPSSSHPDNSGATPSRKPSSLMVVCGGASSPRPASVSVVVDSLLVCVGHRSR